MGGIALARFFTAEAVRSTAFSSITDSYAAIGATLSKPAQILIIKNTTNVTIFVSEDGSVDHYELPAGTADAIDLQTNAPGQDFGVKEEGLQFYVKAATGSLPSSGKVIIQVQHL